MSGSPQPNTTSPAGSPRHNAKGDFLVPSPVPTRRSRTFSASERAMAGPTHRGKIHEFCREKGHGFIKPSDGGDLIFVHISDIEGDWIPKPGDDVSYKRCLVPPKNEKFSAVHVCIVHMTEECHQTWDTPIEKR